MPKYNVPNAGAQPIAQKTETPQPPMLPTEKMDSRKQRSLKAATFGQKHVSTQHHENICTCQSYAKLAATEDMLRSRIVDTETCSWRFCANCAYTRARKVAFGLSCVAEWMAVEHDACFVFVTLTQPNFTASELADGITKIKYAVKMLKKTKKVKEMNLGAVTKIEVTYNKERYITKKMWDRKNADGTTYGDYFRRQGLTIGDKNPNFDTYHAHVHILFAVKASYFKSRQYIHVRNGETSWLGLWRHHMGDDRIMNVHAVGIDDEYMKRHGLSSKRFFEITKYAAKDEDYTQSQKVFDTMYNALKGRQILTRSGLFAKGNKLYDNYLIKLKKGNIDLKSHEMYDYVDFDSVNYKYLVRLRWFKKKYEQTGLRELSPEECEYYGGMPEEMSGAGWGDVSELDLAAGDLFDINRPLECETPKMPNDGMGPDWVAAADKAEIINDALLTGWNVVPQMEQMTIA